MTLKERLKTLEESIPWQPPDGTESLIEFVGFEERGDSLILKGYAENSRAVELAFHNWQEPLTSKHGNKFSKLLPNLIWRARTQDVDIELANIEEQRPKLLCVYDTFNGFSAWNIVRMDRDDIDPDTVEVDL